MRAILTTSFLCLAVFAQAQIVPIYDIQGSGTSSPYNGNTVTTEGLVTADFQASSELDGFFLQDTSGDGMANTSDGIFIRVDESTFNVNVGDYIRITAKVEESFGFTRMVTLDSASILSTGGVPVPVDVTLPWDSLGQREHYEGMYIRFTQTLTTTENWNLGRRGTIALSAIGLPRQVTDVVDPNDDPATGTTDTGAANIANIDAYLANLQLNRIDMNDGSNDQNLDPVPYLSSSPATHRAGTTVDTLVGNVNYSFGSYRLEVTGTPDFSYASRPSAPQGIWGSRIRIASFNVGNLFNGDGMGGGWPSSRGADDQSEYQRQLDKIVAAILGLDAAIIGLAEIENDGHGPNSAIDDLVDALNAAVGSNDTFRFIPHPDPGSDDIQVGMIYRLSQVHPMAQQWTDGNSIWNRRPLGMVFEEPTTSRRFWVIMNHFKSKSCFGSSGLNDNQDDGQGCYNETRRRQSLALIDMVGDIETTTGDTNFILLGDFNAYGQEDPMDILAKNGFRNVTNGIPSYLFGGTQGALDHIWITADLATTVTDSGSWRINSPEPRVLDYNTENNPGALYVADEYRSSDHDPIYVDLDIGLASNVPTVHANAILTYPNPFNEQVVFAIPEGPWELLITDVVGRTLHRVRDSVDQYVWTTDHKGVLLYSIRTQQGTSYGKLVSH